MKKLKNIIIMLIVLVVLVIAYLVFSPMWREDENGSETTQAPAYEIPDLNADSLVGIEIEITKEEQTEDTSAETSGEATVEKITSVLKFSLNDDHTKWLWSEDADIPLDNVAFATIVQSLNDATSKYKLEGVSNADLEEYGLADPYIRARFSFADGSTREIKFGAFNSFNSLYYFVDLAEPTTVYMVAKKVAESLDLDILDFVLEETPPKINANDIISVTYKDGDSERVFTYYPEGDGTDYTDKYLWYCEHNGIRYPLDGTVAETLTNAVSSLAFESCAGLDFANGDYDFSADRTITLKYSATADDNSGIKSEKTYVIHVGEIKDDSNIYVHTADSKLVYLLGGDKDWASLLGGDMAALAPNELWLPNYERIYSITFAAGENSLTVNVENKDGKISYSSEVSKDSEKISALLKLLQDTAATSNTAYFEGDASADKKTLLSLTVKLNSGDLSELEMRIETYSTEYCRVYFDGRDDQLITLQNAEKIVNAVSEFFNGETTVG